MYKSECCTAAAETFLLGCSGRRVSFTFTLRHKWKKQIWIMQRECSLPSWYLSSAHKYGALMYEKVSLITAVNGCCSWSNLAAPAVVGVYYDAWNGRERVGLAALLLYTSGVTHSLCVCVRSSPFESLCIFCSQRYFERHALDTPWAF